MRILDLFLIGCEKPTDLSVSIVRKALNKRLTQHNNRMCFGVFPRFARNTVNKSLKVFRDFGEETLHQVRLQLLVAHLGLSGFH